MGHVIEEPGRKSLNVELNIVPFIDLMSCLTAFLLVTAVWIGTAQLAVQPKVRGVGTVDEDPRLSVLIESDQLWIGLSRVNEFERIPRGADGHDWTTFERRLAAHKTSSMFSETTQIEIAAAGSEQPPVTYDALVSAMDVAVKTGFSDVQVTNPGSLSASPRL